MKVRRPTEIIAEISVLASDDNLSKIKKKSNNYMYEVFIAMEAGEEMQLEKSMQDFRKFDKALKLLAPEYQFSTSLPPEWVDEIPLNQPQIKERCEILNHYIAENEFIAEIFDLLILQWVKTGKNSFRETTPVGENVKISPTDSREVIIMKMNQVLSFVYKKQNQDPSRFFLPGNDKIGDLAVVLYEWSARDGTELSFLKGDLLVVAQKKSVYDGWWYGQKIDAAKGLFPSNYVQILDGDDLRKALKIKKPSSPPAEAHKNLTTQASMLTINSQATPPPEPKRPTMQAFTFESERQMPVVMERERKIEQHFCLKAVESYDELLKDGYTFEQNGKYIKPNIGAPKDGDSVILSFSAYVWNPQNQQLIEFSSSDRLKAPPQGISSGKAGESGNKIEFIVGDKSAIEGLDEVMHFLEISKPVRVIIAPFKGYGEVGSPPEIPGDCFLVYDLILEKLISAGTYMPPRKQIFSVGISRPPIMNRSNSARGKGDQQLGVYASMRIMAETANLNSTPSPYKAKRKKRTTKNEVVEVRKASI